MMRSPIFAASLLGCLAACADGAVHAQSDAYLYVGADASVQTRGFGTATVSASGTTASGLFAPINADPSTTDYAGLSAFGTGQITVTGGTFQQLLADDSSVINLVGYNLAESEDFYFSSIGDPYYIVSGTLKEEQTPFTAQWYAPSTGTLEFNGVPTVPGGAPAVPEASTVVSFGLLLVGAAWLAVKRRKVAV